MTRSDPDRYDFFVSYARADDRDHRISRFVAGILAERPLTPFFDTSEIHSGDDWEHRIRHAVAESRVFLAFVSPNYLASPWCEKEWRAWIDAEIAKHVFTDGAIPVYIVEVPGFQDSPNPSPLLKQLRRRQFVDALQRADLSQLPAGLARDIDARALRVRHAAQSANTVPPYNKKFSGRIDELLDLRTRLTADRAGVVCGVNGLGGMGKTELAFAYAHAFAGVYPGGRLLVPCDGKPNMRAAALALGDFPDFRAAITDEERKIPDALFAAIRACLDRRLAEKGNILLVLDNVTDPALMTAQQTDELTTLGPKVHLLMTTRLAPPAGANCLTLGELPEPDAMDLLEKHRPFADDAEHEAAQRIVRRLGGFAMAVELVAAWLAAHEGSTYQLIANTIGLEDLEAIAEDETAELRRHNHERRLSAVLGPVLASLNEVEQRTMEMAAFLPPDTVALPWLKTLVTLEATRLIADPWVEICSHLTKLALFSPAGEEDTWRVRVHRLVQEVVKRRMPPGSIAECQQAVADLIRERDAALEQTTLWQTARWELEPLDALANLWADTDHAWAAWLLNRAGQCRKAIAEWTRAEPLMRRALAIDEASFRADHPGVAIVLNNLAMLLEATNRLSEAEPLMRRALAIDEASYGTDDSNVARDLSNLAHILRATNRPSEAEPLMRRALAIDETNYRANHPIVAIRVNNLGQLLNATNRPIDAEPLIRRALAIDEANYESDHPTVANRLTNLAALLQNTNRLTEAEPLIRRSLTIDEGSYGAFHPRVAIDLNNLVTLLQATNRPTEAEPLMRRALAIDEASYPADHPRVAIDLNNLAQLLQATNRLSEAEPLMRRHLEILLAFTRNTHHEHPHLRDAMMNYCYLLTAMNLTTEARLDKLGSLSPESLAVLQHMYTPGEE